MKTGGENNIIHVPDRCCLSCGSSINHQRLHSRFCSAKYFGALKSKQCRNKHSNLVNNKKRTSKNKVPLVHVKNIEISKEDQIKKLKAILKTVSEKYSTQQ